MVEPQGDAILQKNMFTTWSGHGCSSGKTMEIVRHCKSVLYCVRHLKLQDMVRRAFCNNGVTGPPVTDGGRVSASSLRM